MVVQDESSAQRNEGVGLSGQAGYEFKSIKGGQSRYMTREDVIKVTSSLFPEESVHWQSTSCIILVICDASLEVVKEGEEKLLELVVLAQSSPKDEFRSRQWC